MRIVGGRLKGRALKSPSSSLTRPTSDRLRESLFNVLAHAYGDPCEGARVLDLFAGTGALGIEALSRGARFALFVEEAAEARGLIRDNVEALGLTGVTKLFRRDATRPGRWDRASPTTSPLRSALRQGPGRASDRGRGGRRLAHHGCAAHRRGTHRPVRDARRLS